MYKSVNIPWYVRGHVVRLFSNKDRSSDILEKHFEYEMVDRQANSKGASSQDQWAFFHYFKEAFYQS